MSNIEQMTTTEIRERLVRVADELVEAQGRLGELLDGGVAKVAQYVQAEGCVKLLQAEEARLVRELPRANQRELDEVERMTDATCKAASEALHAARQAVAERLRSGGFSTACNRELGEIVEMEDSVKTLRGQYMTAANEAHAAAMRAARHRLEHFPTPREK